MRTENVTNMAGHLSILRFSRLCERGCSDLRVLAHIVSKPQCSNDPGQCRQVVPAGSGKRRSWQELPLPRHVHYEDVRGASVRHLFYVLNEAVKRGTIKVAHSYAMGTLIAFCVQLAIKAYFQLLYLGYIDGLKNGLASYVRFDERKCLLRCFLQALPLVN